MILLDTNLLTRMTRSHDSQSGVARTAIQTLLARGERLKALSTEVGRQSGWTSAEVYRLGLKRR